MNINIIRFNQRLPGGSVYRLGTAVQLEDGWRFVPNVTSRRSSGKAHPTWEKCVPRWVGYPDGCETETVCHQMPKDEPCTSR